MFRTRDANGNTKYSARSKAIVLDNRDPLNRGRIIVDHPLLGNTVWIDYLRVPGVFSVPSIGDVVYVECDSGTYEFPVAWGNVTKGEDAFPELPSKFKRDIPTNRGFFTPGGHSLELDDGVATITSNPDDTQFTTSNRGIRLTSVAGNKVHVNDGEGNIIIEDISGNTIRLDYANNEIQINCVGDQNNTTGGNYRLIVSGNVTIQCANATVEASGNAVVTAAQIQLNGTAGDVLTNQTDPVVDTIFGTPTVGVPTVKSG